jgi:HEAT repeat protein
MSRRARTGLPGGAATLVLALVLSGCSSSPDERRGEIYECKRDPTPANVEQIRTYLDDDDRDVRATAMFAIVDLDAEGAREVALAALDDPDGFVRRTAADSIAMLDDPTTVPHLTRVLLEDEDPRVRRAAAETLRQIGGPDAVVALSQALEDPMKEVRLSATKGVAQLDPLSSIETLSLMVIKDPDWNIRAHAAAALGDSGLPEVIPALVQAENDSNEFVRAAAATAREKLE